MENNSQFTIRKELTALNTPAPSVTTTSTNGSNNASNSNTTDPNTNTTTTTTTTGENKPDTNTGGTGTTTTTVEDKPTPTNASTEDKPKAECSKFCQIYNVLHLGMYAGVILLLLALSYQAVKSVGKAAKG